MKSPLRDERGAALLNCLLGLAVLAVFAEFIALPAVALIQDKMAAYELDNVARQVAGEVRYLEEMSLHYQRGHDDFPNAEKIAAPKMVFLGNSCQIVQSSRVLRQLDMPPGILISPNVSELTFTQGRAQPMTIDVFRGGHWRFVIVDSAGRARVSDKRPE